MGTPHKHAELIKAWADGAEIEVFNLVNGKWQQQKDPSWYEGFDYRIKKNAVKTVGYRRYVLEEDGKYYVYSVYEDKFCSTWEGMVKTENENRPWTFVKWLDYEFQYNEVEV